MKSWQRSGVVVQIGEHHALLNTADLSNAMKLQVGRIEHASGLRLLVPHIPSHPEYHLTLVNASPIEATITIDDKWLPMLESSPQICKCENGHDGWWEGEKCSDCGKLVHCTKL